MADNDKRYGFSVFFFFLKTITSIIVQSELNSDKLISKMEDELWTGNEKIMFAGLQIKRQ